jgi:4-hydroxy-tetrahydrodipicolinate synthase
VRFRSDPAAIRGSIVFHLFGRDTLMWSGIELLCLPLLAIGGIGFVSAVANLAAAVVNSP